MIYEIQSKSNFQEGATLMVTIPEADLDHKAMNTILAERPDFLLPFRHRLIDGQIELTYQIGNRSKIAYYSGKRTPAEYANMWFDILQPLLDCSDWFMNPYSFVLSPEHLYCDKADHSVYFVYIPSIHACSEEPTLKKMITEVARMNPVSDVNIENKVVWAIQDFNINTFLQMMRAYRLQSKQEPIPVPVQQASAQPAPQVVQEVKEVIITQKEVILASPAESMNSEKSQSNEIVINFPADGKPVSEKKKKSGLLGGKKEKETKSKPRPESKEKGGIWGKKKAQEEIIGGAAVVQVSAQAMSAPPSPSVYALPVEADDDVTQLDRGEVECAKFRYIGAGGHPRVIEVPLSEGEIFTIGRFDASVGAKQSNFEFDKKTKAVSRRHAAVEKNTAGYSIVDLDSGAGTFLNGQKLPANAPFKLENGSRVSFGYDGADYVWEE